MKIAMIAAKPNDVRAIRAGRYLTSKGHAVVVVSKAHNGPEPLRLLEPIFGIHRVMPKLADLMRTVETELAPDLVWCHDLAGIWRYAASATLTERIEAQILEGATLAELDWDAVRSLNGKTRLVYDAHEWERDRPHQFHRVRHVTDWIERERRVMRAVDRVVTVTEELADAWVEPESEYFPKGRTRPAVITNAPFMPTHSALEYSSRRELARAELDRLCGPERRGPIVTLSGSPSPDRDLSTLASYLVHTARGVRFAHFGVKAPENVFGVVPDVERSWDYPWPGNERLDLLDYLAACDVGFSGGWVDFKQWAGAGPNKMYEYAFAGIPQVSPIGRRTFERLDREYGIGEQYEMGNMRSLEQAIDRALARDPRSHDYDFARFRACENYATKNGPIVDRLLEELC